VEPQYHCWHFQPPAYQPLSSDGGGLGSWLEQFAAVTSNDWVTYLNKPNNRFTIVALEVINSSLPLDSTPQLCNCDSTAIATKRHDKCAGQLAISGEYAAGEWN